MCATVFPPQATATEVSTPPHVGPLAYVCVAVPSSTWLVHDFVQQYHEPSAVLRKRKATFLRDGTFFPTPPPERTQTLDIDKIIELGRAPGGVFSKKCSSCRGLIGLFLVLSSEDKTLQGTP